jgi:hypothetical protein
MINKRKNAPCLKRKHRKKYTTEFVNYPESGGNTYLTWYGALETVFKKRMTFFSRSRIPFFGWDSDRHRTWLDPKQARLTRPRSYYQWPWNHGKI